MPGEPSILHFCECLLYSIKEFGPIVDTCLNKPHGAQRFFP